MTLPNPATCYAAFASRDPRFDGLFFLPAFAEPWQPWRSYAAMHFWKQHAYLKSRP